jgi:hypothetical protein
MANRIYLSSHPKFQFRSAKPPLPEITVGGYAPFASPSLDRLGVEATQNVCGRYAVEERFNERSYRFGQVRSPVILLGRCVYFAVTDANDP